MSIRPKPQATYKLDESDIPKYVACCCLPEEMINKKLKELSFTSVNETYWTESELEDRGISVTIYPLFKDYNIMGAKPKTKPIYKIENDDQITSYVGTCTMFSDEIKKKLEKLGDKSLAILYRHGIKPVFTNFLYREDLAYWSARELEDRGIFVNRLWKFIFESDSHLTFPPDDESN